MRGDILIQLLGLLFLGGGLFWGYRRWIRPRAVDLQSRGLLLLLILTLMGGFIGAIGWWFDDPRAFSWDLPPLAARMLAAAGWAFAVVCIVALNHPTFRRVRLVLWLLSVYLTPLAVVIILFHLVRFDPAAPITYAFFGIVAVMVVSTLWYLLRQPVILPGDDKPTKGVIRLWLLIIAALGGLWGLALFVTDSGPSGLIWAWPGDLLTSRLIGVMLLAIGVGSIYSFRYVDTAHPMLAMILTYGLGVSVASLWNALAGKPVPMAYFTVFSVVAVVSAIVLFYRFDK